MTSHSSVTHIPKLGVSIMRRPNRWHTSFLLSICAAASVYTGCGRPSSLMVHKTQGSISDIGIRRCYLFVEALNSKDYELLRLICTSDFMECAGDIAWRLDQYISHRRQFNNGGHHESFTILGHRVVGDVVSIQLVHSSDLGPPVRDSYEFKLSGQLISSLYVPGYY